MTIACIFRSDLRITSKETALEFYKGVKSCILIPYTVDGVQVIRVEPDNLFSVIPVKSIKDGSAPFIPSLRDEDGSLAYRYRKYINAYLKKD
jgi:hypothetical protein